MSGLVLFSLVALAGKDVGASSSYGNVTVTGRESTPALYPPILAEQTAGKLSGEVKGIESLDIVVSQRFVTGLTVPEGSYLVTVMCAKSVRRDFSLTTSEAIHGQMLWSGSPKEVAKVVGTEIAFRAERLCSG
jgi:hypothetical protein